MSMTRAGRAVAMGIVVLAAGPLAWASTAHAQNSPQTDAQHAQDSPQTDAQKEATRSKAADAVFEKGKERYQRGDLKGAYEAYRTAWSLKQSVDIAANLANAEILLGLKTDAAGHLLFCLRSFPPTGNKAQLRKIEEQFKSVRAEVGSILVEANVEGAEITFDGEPVGRTPLPQEVFVKPGAHTVEARLAGHAAAPVSVDVAAGETRTARLTVLPKKEEPPAPALGPRVEPAVPMKGDTAIEPRTAVIVGGAAVAGAGVVAGVALAVIASGRDSDAAAQRSAIVAAGGPAACAETTPACAALRDTVEDAADLKNAALWTFVGAGAVGLATGAYALFAPSTPRTRVVAAPAVTPHGAGIGIRGTW